MKSINFILGVFYCNKKCRKKNYFSTRKKSNGLSILTFSEKYKFNLLPLGTHWASLVAQMVKNLPAMQETRDLSLDWEDPLEEETATHSNMLPGEFNVPRSLVGCSP